MATSTLTSKMSVISLMGLMLLVQAFHCFSESQNIYEPQPLERFRLRKCIRNCVREKNGDDSGNKLKQCVKNCLAGHLPVRKSPPPPAPVPTFPPPSSYPPSPTPPPAQPTYLHADDEELDDADAQELENLVAELLHQDGFLDGDEGNLDWQNNV